MKHKPTGATSPERGTTGRGTAIEWRRYFYDGPDGALIALAVLISVLAGIVFSGAILFATVYSSHPSIVMIWIGAGTGVAAFALYCATLSGVLPSRENRVSVEGGITHVRAGVNRLFVASFLMFWLGILAVGVGLIAADRVGALHLSNDRRYPALVAAVAGMVLASLWGLAFARMGKSLGFSPHGIVGRFNTAELDVPWDSIREVRIHNGPSAIRPHGLGRNTEIAISCTSAATVPWAPKGADTSLSLIALGFFDVDEDTLYNVILAARSHPEIRHLLGREEGTILFDGPPLDTRRAMSRSQVWLPWEQRIREALGRDTGAEPAGESPRPAAD